MPEKYIKVSEIEEFLEDKDFFPDSVKDFGIVDQENVVFEVMRKKYDSWVPDPTEI